MMDLQTKRKIIGGSLLVASLLLLVFIVLCLLWRRKSSPYRTGRLAVLTSTDEGNSFYVVDLASKRVNALFSIGKYRCSGQLFWSPDRNGLVIANSGITGLSACIVNVAERRFVELGGWVYYQGGFDGWTSDGRYAIFSNGDHYGNTGTTVFDTWQWTTIISTTSDVCFDAHGMGGMCNRRAIAISPFTPTLLLRDGTVLNLTDLTETTVFSKGVAYFAQWSSDANYLVVMHRQIYPRECHLYLANADGTQAFPLATVSCDYETFQWESDEKHAVLSTKTEKYVLDLIQQQVKVFPVDANSTQSTPQEHDLSLCGNCDVLLGGESPLGKVTAACWSPDRTLLAVGKPGTLNLYDADLNLLRTFVVSGTVETLAWSLAYDR